MSTTGCSQASTYSQEQVHHARRECSEERTGAAFLLGLPNPFPPSLPLFAHAPIRREGGHLDEQPTFSGAMVNILRFDGHNGSSKVVRERAKLAARLASNCIHMDTQRSSHDLTCTSCLTSRSTGSTCDA